MLESLVVALLALPIVAIIGMFMAIGTRTRLRELEQRFNALELRLDRLSELVTRRPQAEIRATGPAPAAAPPPPVSVPVSPAPTPQAAPESIKQTIEPAAAPAAQPPPPPPPRPTAPARPPVSFEERFGTQWVVWVGGFALALGGLFLVRYSIQQGLIGPAVRIALGAILAVALVAAGEWTRRNALRTGFAGVPSADIPSILTAAGTTVAYADVYAAYALYQFLSPGPAFVLLGAVALATLAAALLHGATLAGLGLVGAYVTPLLVSTGTPNYEALYLYLAIVTAAAFALARARLWRWLAVTALVFAVLWTFPGVDNGVEALSAHVFHVVVGFALAAALLVCGLLYGPPAKPAQIDAISSGALAAFLAVAAVLVLASDHAPVALGAFAVLVAATCAIAWRAEAATAAVPVAAILAAMVMAHWAVNTDIEHLIAPAGPLAGSAPEPARGEFGWHLTLGAGFAVLFAATGFLAQGRSESSRIPILWSASAVFAPLAILAALYYRIAGFDRSIPFATLALGLAALAAYATDRLDRRPPRPGLAASGAIFATGAVASLALALTMALEKGWLTIALALMVPGIAWVADKRPLPGLRVLAAIVVALVMARLAYEPRIVGDDVGTTPIVNWLLYGYGIPAAAFWLAGHLLRRRADDAPTRSAEAGAIVLTVLVANLEIRHIINGGDIYARTSTLAEAGLQVAAWIALAIGLERLRLRSHSIVHNIAAMLLAALALAGATLGLCLVANPMLTGEAVGGRFLNLILLGYALPALLAAVLALVARGVRPQPYSAVAAVAAVVLALLYLSLETRRLYHGPVLTVGPTTDAEQYTYSAVWLAFGVVLLAAGVWLRSQPVRFASAAVVVVTVLKVFLVDLSRLTGIYQALSFIGLGIVLLGIGWFYQRLLFRPRSVAGA